METRIRALAALSLAAVTSLTACVEGAGDPDTGTVSINLVGQGASGAIYRLRDATFTVAGPDATVWDTEDDPDRTSLSANVAAGGYTATLAPGWRLERLATGMPAVDVVAELISPNPAAFTVAPMMRTEVAFRFAVDGTVVDMSQGYDIVIDIEEEAGPNSILVMPPVVSIVEGATATITVRLAAAPAGTVPVAVSASDPSAIAVSPTTLVFTPANWSIPQVLTLNALHDADILDESVALTLASPGMPSTTVAVNVADDDVLMILTTVSNLTLFESSTATLGVRLSHQPASLVTVQVLSSDGSAAAVAPSVLTFTPANWNVFQNVTVAGVEDADNLNEMLVLTLSATGAPLRTVAVVVDDND